MDTCDLSLALTLYAHNELIMKNCIVDDKDAWIGLSADNRFVFNDNDIIDHDHAIITPSRYGIGSVVGNEIGSGSIVLKRVDVHNNSFKGKISINLESPPRSFSYNNISGFLNLYAKDEQKQQFDIRYNYWGRDWFVEEVIGLDEWKNEVDLIYEPYFDGNGTLTDNDGIPNGWEYNNGMSIYINDTSFDPDNDGLSNLEEYQLGGGFLSGGLDPKNNDTDNDGMDDGWEVEYGLDPFVHSSMNDTDKDGWTDGSEYNESTNPLDPTSHPVIADRNDDQNLSVIILLIIIGSIIVISAFIFLMIVRVKKDKKLNDSTQIISLPGGNITDKIEAVELEEVEIRNH